MIRRKKKAYRAIKVKSAGEYGGVWDPGRPAQEEYGKKGRYTGDKDPESLGELVGVIHGRITGHKPEKRG